jgi:hypothetical protein
MAAMTSPLPIPVGTLCRRTASKSYPEHVGELCTVTGYAEPGRRRARDGGTVEEGWAYVIEYDNPDLARPSGEWTCLPCNLKPLPPPPLSITLLDELEAL